MQGNLCTKHKIFFVKFQINVIYFIILSFKQWGDSNNVKIGSLPNDFLHIYMKEK